ncbi:hypothetical protein ABB37_08011 [Leptomonas pyrrhocoris]|uniref:Methyltransferase domain-containing protein n=1 Tax=Leptomonas pyrrhocoris TaxID=157538 RepID=A0A0M9FUL6_LEPPY|nr:hypothetical protein ABB37_08011 [Leptomonas pyrrhocoris]XP_015654718.1 hypothetical protein ABB37_08011 [Leptomonas pyrrhocoris]KPA76278.1 hypothetical protein ABB37_08011 [Leptomonas pyrrhocoris]KPA76279.1 hypothetical protein ABB37_08011 [Leptomonas pyrrhocoris]|eukprot:XP_015654717.1 hypothetical protein ABB37_08011 [Leptomonas pyrrhocoris]
MPAHHSLALPLSAHYAHDSREGFSFFVAPSSSTSGQSSLHPAVDAYLDDLCTFLRGARLIQSHPDNYFQFMLGETWPASAVHFDGSVVESKELQDSQRLLRGFGPLLHGEDAMAKLRALVRDGPPPPASAFSSFSTEQLPSDDQQDAARSALQALNVFYSTTRRLMLGRARRPDSDAATLTLLSADAARRIDCTSAAAVATREHKQQILDLVVSHGMNPKKQHEVRIMRDTIHDLVDCCNAGIDGQQRGSGTADFDAEGQAVPQAAPEPSAAVRVETVINMGEGKGYVSRAVALCDNLQVIGLDCNPAHKERAVERVESLLETSLSSRDGRPRVNLLYEPRGHVASIACRVEQDVNWATLLQGHVLTCADPHCCCSTAVPRPTASTDAPRDAPYDAAARCLSSQHSADDDGPTAMTVLSRTRGEESVKLACRVCGKVVRLENTTVIMKHVYAHLHDAAATTATKSAASCSRIPTAEQLHTWNLTLSQHAYVAKLTETFFSVTDVESRHYDNRKDAALLKRPRESNHTARDSAGSNSSEMSASPLRYLTLLRASSASCTVGRESQAMDATAPEDSSITLQPTYTARGYRAVLLVARALSATAAVDASPEPSAAEMKVDDACEGDALKGATKRNPPPPSEQPRPQTWVFEQRVATIVGYDGGSDCHHVCLDAENRKRVLRLYRLPPSSSGVPSPSLSVRSAALPAADSPCASSAESFLGEWRLPDPAVWGRAHVAVVLTVLPPALPSTPVVCVPSVRNTVLIGLHPCGDLGSNVCRIFRNSAARGLLLVSCCWHALTPQGFPLSRALRRRGLTTDSVSLLLATQPLDAWSTASPEGHRSSAKLLFYRSLFKLLWSRLAREWTAAAAAQRRPCRSSGSSDGDGDAPARCEFPVAPPHLEPTFLRRMSRQKETLTFADFMKAIAAEYLYGETAKDTPYTPWSSGHRCAACRDDQEAFIRSALTVRALPAQMARTFEGEHFAPFLGLTVLRMWMCHLVESLLLLDRTLYLHEELRVGEAAEEGEDSAVSLVPLFDGALSPRMYGVLARRGGAACVC